MQKEICYRFMMGEDKSKELLSFIKHQATHAFVKWMEENGVIEFTEDGDMLEARATIVVPERLNAIAGR